MGCGASAQQRYSTRSSCSQGEDENGETRRASWQSTEEDEKQSIAATAPRGRDCTWHYKNCTDADLQMAVSTLEAYPFDDTNRKVKQKNLKRIQEQVSVVKMGPKSISCSECGEHILNRYETGCFFFCLRCRKEGKQYDVCTRCYQNFSASKRRLDEFPTMVTSQSTQSTRSGRSGQSAAPNHLNLKSPKYSSQDEVEVQSVGSLYQSAESYHSYLSRPGSGARRLLGTESNSLSPNGCGRRPNTPNAPTPSKNVRPVSPKISPRSLAAPSQASLPSGMWRGKLSEGGSNRDATYTLYFNTDLSLDGSGPEGAIVEGSAARKVNTEYNERKVTWTESHEWGCIAVTAEIHLDDIPMRILGKFKASDGGGGKIELRFTRK